MIVYGDCDAGDEVYGGCNASYCYCAAEEERAGAEQNAEERRADERQFESNCMDVVPEPDCGCERCAREHREFIASLIAEGIDPASGLTLTSTEKGI